MRNWLMMAAAIGTGLILRLCQMRGSLWYDEAFSAWMAGLPVANLLAATAGDVHPPGYYFLLKATTATIGQSEFALRLPSLLAGVLLIPVVYALARALNLSASGRSTAVLLIALSPFQIYYSTEARSYAILSLLIAVLALALLSGRDWLAVLPAVAAVYMHNTGAIFVTAVWLAAMLYRKSYRPIRPLVCSGVLSLPALVFLLPQAGAVGAGYWVPPLNHPGRIVATLDDLIWFHPENPYVMAVAIITSLALSLMIYDLRQIIHKKGGQFCLLLTVIPLAIISLASLVWQPILISRVLAPSAPFLLLLLAQIVSTSKQRIIIFGWFSAPVWGLIAMGIVSGQLGRDPVDASLQADMRAVDGIYHANVGSYVVWHYYLPDVPQFVWPQQTTVQQTLSPQTRTAMGMNEIDFDFIKCVSLADGIGNVIPIRRWALIYFHNPTTSIQEIEYVARLHQQYRARKLRNLRSDPTTEAWLSIIEPECDYAEQFTN